MTKRMEVAKLTNITFFNNVRVDVKISNIGKEKYRTHPLQPTVYFYKQENIDLLEVGDLVRCDGLPYSYNRNPPPRGYKWTRASTLHRFYSLRKIKC